MAKEIGITCHGFRICNQLVSVCIPDSFSQYKIMFYDNGNYWTSLCREVSIEPP
jgi:hypothetical protein